MSHVCPVWIGRLLASPLRRLIARPDAMLEGLVLPGMTVLEPGCAMGYFTLPLARLVGDSGRVIAVDIQEAMLQGLQKRAAKAGLSSRIESRLASEQCDVYADLTGTVDVALGLFMVHETPDAPAFLQRLAATLKPGGKFLLAEPRFHVSSEEFEKTIAAASRAGFLLSERSRTRTQHLALFIGNVA